MPRPIPEQAYLRECLDYDPESGALRWKTSPRKSTSWNAKHMGRRAGYACKRSGYRNLRFDGVAFREHRVVWAYVHGSDPAHEIDHINGVRDDNRIANLRDVTPCENQHNYPRPRNNASGVVGVRWQANRGKWVAYITSGNRFMFLGRFAAFDEAVSARKVAERLHNFHPNHGREAVPKSTGAVPGDSSYQAV